MRHYAIKIRLAGALLMLLLLPTHVLAGEKKEIELPMPARLVLGKAQPLMQAKAYQQAIDAIKTFQARGGDADTDKNDPKGYHHPDIEFCLGNCYLMLDRFQAAAEAYQCVLARDPEYTFAWLNLANAHYEMAHHVDAGYCFERAYATSAEKKADYLYYSAVAYLMGDDHRRSIEMFDRLFTLHPDAVKPEWKEHVVHALLAVDQPRRALPFIRELAAAYTGEKRVQWQEILLQQYMQLEMPRMALDLARQLSRETPTQPKWWKALAHIQLNGGHYEEALMALTVYSFLTPLSLDERQLLADLNLQLDIPVKAAPLYEACMQEKPDKRMLRQLALAYRQLGQPERALSTIGAMGADMIDGDILLLKGELHYGLKQFDQAAAAYRKATTFKGRHVGRAWLMAGYAAWQTNDIAASRAAFTQAAKHPQQRKAANRALEQLARLSPDASTGRLRLAHRSAEER